MRTSALLLVVGLAAPTYGGASRPADEDKIAAESKKLSGTWEVESTTLAGRAIPREGDAVKMEFKGFTVTTVGTGTVRTFALDPSTDPRRVTLFEAEVKNGVAAPKAGGEVSRAVYALDGDVLTIAQWRGPKAEYPKSVAPKAGDPVMVIVLKRVKN